MIFYPHLTPKGVGVNHPVSFNTPLLPFKAFPKQVWFVVDDERLRELLLLNQSEDMIIARHIEGDVRVASHYHHQFIFLAQTNHLPVTIPRMLFASAWTQRTIVDLQQSTCLLRRLNQTFKIQLRRSVLGWIVGL